MRRRLGVCIAVLGLVAWPAMAGVVVSRDRFGADDTGTAYVTRVFHDGGRLYVTFDNIRIDDRDPPSGEGEALRVIVNDSRRLRTYEVPPGIESESAQCQPIAPSRIQSVLQRQQRARAFVLYHAEDGRLTYLNTGCWE